MEPFQSLEVRPTTSTMPSSSSSGTASAAGVPAADGELRRFSFGKGASDGDEVRSLLLDVSATGTAVSAMAIVYKELKMLQILGFWIYLERWGV